MNIGILGSGEVARALALGFMDQGHAVMLGTRSPEKLDDWLTAYPDVQAGSFRQAAGFGELLVLAVKGTVAQQALDAAGRDALAGKTLIDVTNPIADEPPVDGVLQYFTAQNESLMERLQGEFPEVAFVKAFNSVGNRFMYKPDFPGGPPTMFICGNDEKARHRVARIVESFGWEVADMGSAKAAGAIESLCVLWCIPGFRNNEWTHAFKLLHKP